MLDRLLQGATILQTSGTAIYIVFSVCPGNVYYRTQRSGKFLNFSFNLLLFEMNDNYLLGLSEM